VKRDGGFIVNMNNPIAEKRDTSKDKDRKITNVKWNKTSAKVGEELTLEASVSNQKVNGDSVKRFEDYWLQDAYTESSAFRYPLQMIPFYHYDPRRYYVKSVNLKNLAKNICDKHAFFNLKMKDANWERGYRTLADITTSIINPDYIYDNILSDKYITVKLKKELRRIASYKPHDEAVKNIFPKGACMGVKMYPALGYPPNLYDNPQKNDKHDDNIYENMKELFKHCKDNGVPVTANCSPLGMTIADGFNYQFRDAGSKKEFYPIKESCLYVDKICGYPGNWEKVISDFPDLKVNLAHFGGMSGWHMTEKEHRKEFKYYYDECVKKWKDKMISLATTKDNVYTDISCYTFNSSRDLIYSMSNFEMEEIMKKCNGKEKFFIKSCYWQNTDNLTWWIRRKITNSEKNQLMDIYEVKKIIPKNAQFKNIAVNLANAIKKNSKLKEKIMMGSDWYMIEKDGLEGAGVYYGRMFELLRYITKELDDKWDVWHQFSVVNPLKFLGFLKTKNEKNCTGDLMTEDYKGKKVYIWNRSRIEKYLKNFKNIAGKGNVSFYKTLSSDDKDNFEKQASLRLEQLMHSKIFTSEDIKNSSDKLVMTSIVG
jgi:hypothetical protein